MINSNNADRIEDAEVPMESGFKINDLQFPLILVLATSFVLLIAVFSVNEGGYTIAIPILSLIISLAGILLTIFKAALYTLYGKWLTLILFMWNFTGASFLTFGSPFTTTGNGYFAAWGCVAASAMAQGFTGDAFQSKVQGLGSLLGLCASATIVVIALLEYLGGDIVTYCLIVAILTIALVVGIMYYEKNNANSIATWFPKAKFGVLALFALLWLILACLATFNHPFMITGNGYFASWAGAACAWFATFSAWKDMGISTEDVVGFLTPSSNSDGRTGLSATVT